MVDRYGLMTWYFDGCDEKGNSDGEYVRYEDYAYLEAENARLKAIVRQIVMEDDGRYVLTELGVRRIEAAEAAAEENKR